ncbi:MAG: hypothetical protein EP343_21350 [Deltaproteobacteria bacterium]|nr:MAG: hypothetical protein EP343_21350 [Deltaproteobacteria bacterium]
MVEESDKTYPSDPGNHNNASGKTLQLSTKEATAPQIPGQAVWLGVLVLGSVLVLGLLVWEGSKEKPSLHGVMNVGGGATRAILETLSSPIPASVEEEKRLGRRILKHVRWLPDQHKLTQRVRKVGKRLARFARRKELSYRFFVVPSASVNAFALPGGYVLITVGLLQLTDPKHDDSELAWVLAHELVHIERKHAWVQLRVWWMQQRLKGSPLEVPALWARLMTQLLRLGYSETMELEADRGALDLVRKADFLPKASISLMKKMQSLGGKRAASSSRHPWILGVQLTQKTLRQYWETHPHWDQRRATIQNKLH